MIGGHIQAAALASIADEHARQIGKRGVQNHDPFVYLAILTEEVGELAQAALQTKFGGPHGGADKMREEAVQVAAVALSIVECLDRAKWKWGVDSNDPANFEPSPDAIALVARLEKGVSK